MSTEVSGEPKVVAIEAADAYDLRYRVLRVGTPSSIVEYVEDEYASTHHLGVEVDGQIMAITTWIDQPSERKRAVYGNRRRVKGDRGKRLGKLRSEYVERSFAHVCRTGGARRSWLRGLADVTKRYLMCVAGKNLGVIMRSLFGMGKPKTRQTEGRGGLLLIWAVIITIGRTFRSLRGILVHRIQLAESSVLQIVAHYADSTTLRNSNAG